MVTEETPMEFIVWVETRLAGKTLAVQDVAQFDRCASGIAPEEIGLTLQEGKDVLKQVQRNIVQTQIQVQGEVRPFAWIARWPGEAEQFMKAALQANGWTPQTKVAVLADGADGFKNLVQAAVNSEPCSILDWFHIVRRESLRR
jgi:hypothetical protein